MNLLTFFVALGIGTVVALYMSWRYSRKGIHPRFYPHFGLVAVVFVTLMGGVAFLAFIISHMVGNKLPSVGTPVTPVEEWATPSAPEEKKEEP
jgi:hypothetical protein